MKKFNQSDYLVNRIKSHPSVNFYFVTGSGFYNHKIAQGQNTPQGYLSLYDMNVDRDASTLIYPFTIKNAELSPFKTITQSAYDSYAYGDVIQGTYPLTASIFTERYSQGQARPRVEVLRNICDNYQHVNPRYAFSSSYGDFGDMPLSLIEIPNIFFDAGIKRGSVSLKFYNTGSLVAELQDLYYNGSLIEVSGPGSGSTAGQVLYKEGFLLLTGSWSLNDNHAEAYNGTDNPRWYHFGANVSNSTYELDFKGTSHTEVLTLFCHADPGEFNHSNNPTFISSSQVETYSSSSTGYIENEELIIKNVVKSPHVNTEAEFKKTTFISKIAILDEQRNVIALAKLATPVKKTEERALTFKLKLDI